jgi:hypothetical protein
MITVRVCGGLGNQFFQLAAALLLSKKFSLPICLNLTALGQYASPRDFGLPLFVDLKSRDIAISETKNRLLDLRVPRFAATKIGKIAFVGDKNILQAISYSSLTSVVVDGYFIESIDQRFFDQSLVLLKEAALTPADDHPEDCCAVHVRGGDFIKAGWCLDDIGAYYASAVNRLMERFPGIEFRVVTDSPDYASAILAATGVPFSVRQRSMQDDFHLLRRAKVAILSNSTFSFWARALKHHDLPGWDTVAPSHWRPGVLRQIRLSGELTT